jgi:hypothetical protein
MNNDWKPTEINEGQPTNWEPKNQTPEQEDKWISDAMRQAIKDGVLDATPYFDKWKVKTVETPKYSNYKCYLFGNRPDVNCGITYTPVEGRVPNRFVRFMMRICFDSIWVKDK